MHINIFKKIIIIFCLVFIVGCQSTKGNFGKFQSYDVPNSEAVWIINGDPIEFEDELWFPYDGTESLLDSEVYILGVYNGVQFFADKTDVRPYSRLYTKFGKNKFRFFEKASQP
ncbi:MAG: hypothetical protein P9X22_04115 [Candidatus Zapsychrus exili]|nr:hypothetical protein [Candidatus Zapsychrus exili]